MTEKVVLVIVSLLLVLMAIGLFHLIQDDKKHRDKLELMKMIDRMEEEFKRRKGE